MDETQRERFEASITHMCLLMDSACSLKDYNAFH